MDHEDALKLRGKLAALLLSTAVLAAPAATQAAESPKSRLVDASKSLKLHGTPVAGGSERVQVFVQLDQPAVAELNAASVEATGSFAAPEAQREQAARVTAQQSSFKPLLAQHGAEILSAQRVAANGLRIKVRPSEIPRLRNLPGVRSVGRVEIHKLDNIDSVPWIGAPAVWERYGRGEGVKIGIIDSGIDYTHAAFGGSGDPAAYEANDPNVIEEGTFPTAKVVGGFDFAGPDYDANDPTSVPSPDPDPLDLGGHGTHVAGTAAGIGVPDSVGPGVAPGAELYALKVFGDSGGSTDVTSLAIEWAMDPNADGDMSDHLDVINMSLGSPLGEPSDPSAISTNNAAKVGIIVATSAGNEGNTPYITGAPGVASLAISTAANTPGGRSYARFTVNTPEELQGEYPSLEGAGPVTFEETGPISGSLVPGAPLNGCAPLTNASEISGNIAFIIRGTCDFLVKYTNAQTAGAVAIVVYNDGTAADRIDPIVMGGLDDTITIPGLMISSTIGSQLVTASDVTVTLDSVPNAALDDQMATFSSRGPGHGGSTFKPDLSAPGVAIISAGAGTGTGSDNLQGTSMASPHVAGAAALLRQKHPELNQAAIKAMLQNSTVDAAESGDTDLMRQGVGALRVDRAAALSSYASPAGISFGRLNPLKRITSKEKLVVKNLTQKSRNFYVTHVPNQTYPGVNVSCPSRVYLKGHEHRQTEISLSFDPRAAWEAGVFDDGVVSQTEVDGWCVFSDGKDTLRVGYVAVVDPASNLSVLPNRGVQGVEVRNSGPSLGWAEGFTLAKIGGEEQNNTYGSIAKTGFRRADPNSPLYDGLDVLEFGFAMERNFEHLSNLDFEMEVDADSDGVADLFLVGTDLSSYFDVDPGQYAVFQFNAEGDGFADWLVNTWDFNDRALILPFTLISSGGFLPEKFDYVLTVTARGGEQDVQRGSIDLSEEIVPDLNSFGVEPGDSVDVGLSGPKGSTLWLLQNNIVKAQTEVSSHVPPRK